MNYKLDAELSWLPSFSQGIALRISSTKMCTAFASYDWKSTLGDGLVAINIGANGNGISAILREYNIESVSSISYHESDYNGLLASADYLPLSMDTAIRLCGTSNGFAIIFK